MTAVERIPDISATSAWKALGKNHDQIVGTHLREFFAEDPDRGREFNITVGDLYIDYSKHRINRETLKLLTDLARAAQPEQRRDEMFSAVPITISENRAVLHTALRLPRDAKLIVDGQNVVEDVHSALDAMGDFTDQIGRACAWKECR